MSFSGIDYLWNDLLSNEASSENDRFSAFVRAYKFTRIVDLKSLAKRLPEGVLLCTPQIIAGPDHARGILIQASEYWKRQLPLARNRSIDLLMRISCSAQISEAIKASNLEETKAAALLGIVKDLAEIEAHEKRLLELGAMRKDSLILLDRKKERFLRKYHSIPEFTPVEQFPTLLQEKAVLLVFDK